MKVAMVCLLCLILVAPVYAQKSEERQNAEKLATLVFWSGIGVAGAGITPMMAGYTKVGLPFMAIGGGLIYYGIHLNNKAKQMPSTTFAVVPVKKGIVFGVSRSW